jgi:hypothetical protein
MEYFTRDEATEHSHVKNGLVRMALHAMKNARAPAQDAIDKGNF